jgi:hypothetical protein
MGISSDRRNGRALFALDHRVRQIFSGVNSLLSIPAVFENDFARRDLFSNIGIQRTLPRALLV